MRTIPMLSYVERVSLIQKFELWEQQMLNINTSYLDGIIDKKQWYDEMQELIDKIGDE